MNKKHIIYDYDGVLVDTFDITVAIHQNQRGADITPEHIRKLMDANIYEGLKDVIDQTEMESQINDFFKQYHPQVAGLGIIPGVDLVIQAMGEQQIPQHINSSSREQTMIKQLKQSNLASYFYDILGTETDRSKVTKFKQVLNTYQLSPTDIMFVTDTTGDIAEAHTLGIPTIAVTWGYHERERLAVQTPEYLVNKPGDLLHILKNWL